MITYVSGDLFKSPARVLVNTVNTVGVMGKGVARQFKRLFPDMFRKYRDLCEKREFDVGQLYLYKTSNKWVLNFPTKKHWRNPSKPEYIEKGLQKLVSIYYTAGIYDLAMPLIGCGNGELDWAKQVRPYVERYLKNLPINVFIYSYNESTSAIPEHRDIAAIKAWIRSEPENLPFTEVWHDLVQILENKAEFLTLARANTPFKAIPIQTPQGILIQSSGRRGFINADVLLDFWQQLRSYGFTSRQIAPSGLSRMASYLMPIFVELEYITTARISDSYERLHNGTEIVGLQYLPPLEPPSLFQTYSSHF